MTASDATARPLRRLGFLTLGTFAEDRPAEGHEETLAMIELGERLGFDSAWVRHRHLQHGISSPIAVLAAASQRTGRIELGTAVIPLGWENPLRLAEDLATVDVLSGGRLNPGVSVGPPMRYDDVRDVLYPDTADREDFSYARVERLLHAVEGKPVSRFSGRATAVEEFSDHVQPYAPGLRDRMWYGAGSKRSARWAGEHGLNLLTSSVVKIDDTGDPAGPRDPLPADTFDRLQAAQIREFRAHHPLGAAARVSLGPVVVPADLATSAQAERYRAYAAARLPRTRAHQGPAGLIFAPDLVGPSAEIAEGLQASEAFRLVDEVAFALPFDFEPDDYVQILTDIAEILAPLLGRRPEGEADASM